MKPFQIVACLFLLAFTFTYSEASTSFKRATISERLLIKHSSAKSSILPVLAKKKPLNCRPDDQT